MHASRVLAKLLCVSVCVGVQTHMYLGTHKCTRMYSSGPHYPGPGDLCRNYFLFWPMEKGEVARMKTVTNFLCALLGPGCTQSSAERVRQSWGQDYEISDFIVRFR